jgi:aminoglycoside 6'-N-acetyltransferase
MAGPVLRGTRVALRPLRDDDVSELERILGEPGVSGWWRGPWDPENIRRELVHDPESPGFAIEVDGEVAGAIQYYENTEADYRHAGIDVFLSGAHTGRGLGVDAVRVLAAYLFSELGHHRVVIDPAAGNHRAIRAFRKAGFREVGIMRAYERGADGTWHDSMLMEMLAEDFQRSSNG